jgi:hypothetical protein
VGAEPEPLKRARHPLTRVPALLVLVLVGALIALLAYGLVSKSPSNTIDNQLAKGRPATPPGFELAVLQRGSRA